MIIEDVIDFLRKVPPFQFLDDSTLKEIISDASMEFYPKGTFIQYQGGAAPDFVYVIKKGAVKVSIKNENEEVFVDYRGEGDLIGYLLIFGGTKARANVVTIDDTICYLIKRETIQHLLYANPAVREYFNKSFLTRYLDKTFSEIQNKNLVYGGGDKMLFTMPVGEIASKDIIKASENISIQEAAEIMSNYRISCLILIDAQGIPSGIITDRDLRDKVVAKGKDCKHPVTDIMSVPNVRSDAKEYCFEAILKMVKHNVHHLLIMQDEKLKGVLTNHDLMLIQGTSPLSIVKDIESQSTTDALIPVSKKINSIIGLLLNEGAKASGIIRIITEINDRLVRKILELAEERFGEPPVPYCWIVFGSEDVRNKPLKQTRITHSFIMTPQILKWKKRQKNISRISPCLSGMLCSNAVSRYVRRILWQPTPCGVSHCTSGENISQTGYPPRRLRQFSILSPFLTSGQSMERQGFWTG